MSIRLVLAVGALLNLVGCDAITDLELSMSREGLRQECFGNFTNTCLSKTIDFNINILKSVPFEDKKEMIGQFGDEGWALYEEAEQEVKDEVIAVLESMRPSWFSSWILGDAQPFDGKGVIEFSPEDLKAIRRQVDRVFVEKAKTAGLKPTAQITSFQTAGAQSKPEKYSILPTLRISMVPALTLDSTIQSLIADETSTGGGVEYQDARQVVQVDLNGDGADDAVVLFSIEGLGGGNSAYQTLAAFYHMSDGWRFQQKTVVDGSISEIQVQGPNIIGLKVLTLGDDDPMCCPSVESLVKYQWDGTSFVKLTESQPVAGLVSVKTNLSAPDVWLPLHHPILHSRK